jgi:hypothetical protein
LVGDLTGELLCLLETIELAFLTTIKKIIMASVRNQKTLAVIPYSVAAAETDKKNNTCKQNSSA